MSRRWRERQAIALPHSRRHTHPAASPPPPPPTRRRWRERQAIALADNGDAPPLAWGGAAAAASWGPLYGTEALDPSELRSLKVGGCYLGDFVGVVFLDDFVGVVGRRDGGGGERRGGAEALDPSELRRWMVVVSYILQGL